MLSSSSECYLLHLNALFQTLRRYCLHRVIDIVCIHVQMFVCVFEFIMSPGMLQPLKIFLTDSSSEQPREKTNNMVFEKVLHKPNITKYRRWLEAVNFGFRKLRNCTICVAKVTVKLICAFVYAYAKCWFSHRQLICFQITWECTRTEDMQ